MTCNIHQDIWRIVQQGTALLCYKRIPCKYLSPAFKQPGGSIHYHGLTWIPAWISNHIPNEVIMTSSNGNIFLAALPSCGESTGGSPHKGTVTRAFDVSVLSICIKCRTNNHWPIFRDAMAIIRLRRNLGSKIAYSFPNVNGCNTEVWEWMGYFILN